MAVVAPQSNRAGDGALGAPVPLIDATHASGPKAARLAAMLRRKRPVPPGVVLDPDLAARLAVAAPRDFAAWVARHLAGIEPPWVARSSSVAEDGSAQSRAGVFDSVRDCADPRALQAGIARVVASASGPRAVALGLAGRSMPVVVQHQVATTAGGVLFTKSPDTRDDSMLVDVALGGAHTVVDGRARTDALGLDRTGRITSGATAHVPPSVLDQLAHLALGIERDVGGPADIEWGWDGARVWIFQARAVVPAVGDRGDRWTSANSQEALPGPVTPLTWTTLSPLVERGRARMFTVLGLAAPPGEYMVLHLGRPYFNVRYFADVARSIPGLPADLFDVLIFGDAAPASEPALGLSAAVAAIGHPVGRRAIALALRYGPGLVGRLDRRARRAAWRDRCWPGPSRGRERAAQWLRLEEEVFTDLVAHCVGTALAGGSYELARRFGASCGLASDVVVRLLAPPRDTVNRRFARALERLASAMAGAMAGDPTRSGADAADAPVERALARLVGAFGHMAPGAAELATPRYRETPDALLAFARTLVDRPARLHRGSATVPIGGLRGAVLSALVRRARRYHPYRERLKFAALRGIARLRELALDRGRELVASGVLDAPSDVFFLERDELLRAFADVAPSAAWRERARAHAAHRAAVAPARWVADADGKPVALDVPGAGDALVGIPASPGVVCGIARVVRTPLDGARLAPGEILVAPSADPAWCPLFLVAKGAVLETGSRLSHSALLARELGVPCVIGLVGATTRIPDGARVVVDGGRGTVELRAAEPAGS